MVQKFLVFAVLIATPFLRPAHAAEPPTFERDIQPILAKAGCNAGACHGKARGQNGFQLSLLGFDSDFDYAAITAEARGRRIFPAAPEFSLLLRKASGETPHGGGVKLRKDSVFYTTIRDWIAAGTPRTSASAPKLLAIQVAPNQATMTLNSKQPLRVIAEYSDKSTQDVTHFAAFQSNDSGYAAVDSDGIIRTGPVAGDAAITARFLDQFAVCHVLIPLPNKVNAEVYAKLPRNNFVDGHVWNKLQLLGLTPSEIASEATFHRRAFLDIIGRLPTAEEVRAYLNSGEPKKRELLVDALLERPEYADFWANKWADLLRPNPYRVGIKAVFNLDAWLRESFRKNKPYDVFVRELLTAQGSTFRNGNVVPFRDRREPEELTTIVSQLYLGVRLECAKCHQHPSERWSQKDFYSFAAYFSRIGRRGQAISAPISGGEEIYFIKDAGIVKHPLSGETMQPTPLLSKPQAIAAGEDPRVNLAQWITSKNNPFFAKVMANRVWADMMGRGLVDPVDDIRDTNPPSNGPLLDALADDFRKNNFDIKKLIRTIALSHVYSLSSQPNDRNISDIRNHSRYYRVRLRAEVLLDAVSDVTGIPETFSGMPEGSRAMQAWTVRFDSKFLDSFGRPDPNQDPPCERTTDTTVVQALHLMNAPNVNAKISSDSGRAAQLVASKKTPTKIVEELYLTIYSRKPAKEELAACVARYGKKGADRRKVTEDIMWALMNTPEFVFKD